MREKSRQENLKRLKQLEDAKTKLGDKDPKVFDINNEINKINNQLKPTTKSNIVDDVSDEEYNNYFDQQGARMQAQNEPFGQDLSAPGKKGFSQRFKEGWKEGWKDKPGMRQTLGSLVPDDFRKGSVSTSSPMEEAGASPSAPPKTPKEEAIQRPPGGWARRVFRRGKTNQVSPEGKGEASGTEGAAKQTTKQITDRAAKAIKKLASQAVKKLAASIAANPVTWAIVGVGLIIIIILFIVGLSYMGTINSPGPSTSGGKPLIEVKPKDVADANALQKLLKLGGDKTIADQAVNEAASAMKKNLLDTKDLDAVKNNIALTKQIDTALGSLAILEGSKSQESAKTFLTDLGGAYNLMEGNIPTWATSVGPTRLPVAGTVTVFNNDLHGNSFLKTDAVPNHNVYIRGNTDQEKCDAVDIGVTAGEAIYPIFGGKVADVGTDGDGSEGKKVIVTSNDGKYTALYAHIKTPTKNKGDVILTTEPLGIAKTNNIQIEVYYTDDTGNNCLVTNHADMIDHALASRRHQDWGGYLWDRIKTTFNLK